MASIRAQNAWVKEKCEVEWYNGQLYSIFLHEYNPCIIYFNSVYSVFLTLVCASLEANGTRRVGAFSLSRATSRATDGKSLPNKVKR
jgi:hypothetical protein